MKREFNIELVAEVAERFLAGANEYEHFCNEVGFIESGASVATCWIDRFPNLELLFLELPWADNSNCLFGLPFSHVYVKWPSVEMRLSFCHLVLEMIGQGKVLFQGDQLVFGKTVCVKTWYEQNYPELLAKIKT